MQYVNDDMDELFRRAAENYPLDTRGADWNKVLSGLNEGEIKPVRRNNGTKYLWLLLLLPLGLICNRYFSGEELEIQEYTSPASPSAGEAQNAGKTLPAGAGQERSLAGKVNPQLPVKPVRNKAGKDILTEKTGNLVVYRSRGSIATKINAGKNHLAHTADHPEPQGLLGTHPEDQEDRSPFTSYIPIKRKGFVGSAGVIEAHPRYLVSGKTPAKYTGRKTPRFYAGLIGSIDVTSISFQKVDNAGYDKGLLLGYQFNRKWSVETGVFADKKFYYSNGKYFKNPKIYMPPNSMITEVTGNCNMIELPVSIRYNVHTTPWSSWFTTLGLSSYIMKKEDYSFLYYYGNSGTSATHRWAYENSSKNLFSVIQLSGGYTHRLGHIADLRVEPYLKIPVAGIGYGKFYMISSGVHLGLTRKLF